MESQRTTYIEHDNSDLGEVQISNDVLAVISAMAAMEVDGVVAMETSQQSLFQNLE